MIEISARLSRTYERVTSLPHVNFPSLLVLLLLEIESNSKFGNAYVPKTFCLGDSQNPLPRRVQPQRSPAGIPVRHYTSDSFPLSSPPFHAFPRSKSLMCVIRYRKWYMSAAQAISHSQFWITGLHLTLWLCSGGWKAVLMSRSRQDASWDGIHMQCFQTPSPSSISKIGAFLTFVRR